MQPQAAISWESLRSQVALIAQVPASDIDRNTRLVADLGLDSLAVTEVAVVLMEEFGTDALAEGLDEIEWETLTVGRLFDDYVDAGMC